MPEKSIDMLLSELTVLRREIDECLQEEHRLLSDCNYEIETEHVHIHYLKLESMSKGIVALQATVHHHMTMASLRLSYYEARMKYIKTCQALNIE